MGFRRFLILLFVFSGQVSGARLTCYELFHQLRHQREGGRHHEVIKAHGTEVPMAYAQEKEGLNWTDIDHWWDRVEPEYLRRALFDRLRREVAGTKIDSETGKPARDLLNFLRDYHREKYAPYYIRKRVSAAEWTRWSPEEQLRFLFATEDFQARVSRRGINELFITGVLNYDHLLPSIHKPGFVQVGDDLGSYEIRTYGEVNRRKYFLQQAVIEDFLQAKIGHQHLFHAWPEKQAQREAMAGHYVELLDATTHYLYWRQAKRPPDEMDQDSVTWLRFQGIYTRSDLEFLAEAMISGTPENFQRKYRMVGARAFPGRKEMPGQDPEKFYPDYEIRSGNSSSRREFLHDMLSARLSSGDYSGLRDFRHYEFDPAAKVREFAFYLSDEDQAALLGLEQALPPLRSDNRGMRRDVRNKIFAPLLPWDTRLPMDYKRQTLRQAQLVYGEELAEIARDYIKRKARTVRPDSLEKLWEQTQSDIEDAVYRFAHRVRLDEDFERYLTPRPTKLPDVNFPIKGGFDINEIPLGIEFSYRFAESPHDRDAARARLAETAYSLSEAFGLDPAAVGEESGEGHGHNLGAKFYFHLPKVQADGTVIQEKHRIEWDGILRGYRNGVPFWPRGGHAEIPSPKMIPHDTSYIQTLYEVNRGLGQVPRRSAGGAHVNVDLAPFWALPGEEGAQKIANLIKVFERERRMIQFLWQHPFRTRVAIPVEPTPRLVSELNAFRGSHAQLAKLLYDERYFNCFVLRKPAYTQLNATAVLITEVPAQYLRTIDIRNPQAEWFPAFGGKGKDRLEYRLFDAAPDEYLAALQIKYVRALLNQAFNEGTQIWEEIYTADDEKRWREEPQTFFAAAEEHFHRLKLNSREFIPLIAEAPEIQRAIPKSHPENQRFDRF